MIDVTIKMGLMVFSLCLLIDSQAQKLQGGVFVDRLDAPSLQNNPAGENPVRRLSIYLPPGYDKTEERYPVLYYLHGFGWNDSLTIAVDGFDKLIDKAILTHKIRPLIVVIADHHTSYRYSYHINSTYTGNWADFTAQDLVRYMDANFRTLAEKESRAIAGHSGGGFGAIRFGMQHPDVFSVVYALSPSMLGLTKEMGAKGRVYRRVQEISSREELITGYQEFIPNAVVTLGRTLTPNMDKPPFYADLPFYYEGDKRIVNEEVLDHWNRNLPLGMMDNYVANFRQLRALKLDWGRNEEFTHVPVTCRMFSQRLENYGVDHYAEEFIGTHSNKLFTDDGRILNDMLPFLERYLAFD